MKKLTNLDTFKITDGSSFSGFYLKISFDELLERLGKPAILGSIDNKMQLEWICTEKFKDDFKTLTIYDWKEDKPFHKIKEWHIGSKNLSNVEIISWLHSLGFDNKKNEIVKERILKL